MVIADNINAVGKGHVNPNAAVEASTAAFFCTRFAFVHSLLLKMGWWTAAKENPTTSFNLRTIPAFTVIDVSENITNQ
ncbi:hypothetical protein LF1_33680 [Rubripirellula obstinata]|uniref:Uncharacterized protein n=1 Tax=Rubripirellula obstinata TaxID=406547 RepID=A0A5B1CJT0_9BACT|nr:hypothetical protein [Rubripirellula obstinata]KAA1260826.1 hypothetical protein LF1_33680 [Rubripirellula obstinata]